MYGPGPLQEELISPAAGMLLEFGPQLLALSEKLPLQGHASFQGQLATINSDQGGGIKTSLTWDNSKGHPDAGVPCGVG